MDSSSRFRCQPADPLDCPHDCTPSPSCQYAKVVAAYEIFPGATGCGVAGTGAGPAGLSIGPSLNGTNTNGLIALGCGAGGVGSLIIDNSATTILSVPFRTAPTKPGTTRRPITSSLPNRRRSDNPLCAGAPYRLYGSLGVVDANEYPPRSYMQEDGEHRRAPGPGHDCRHRDGLSFGCGVSWDLQFLPTPTRPSQVYVPTRSTLTTPNNIALDGGSAPALQPV